MTTVDDPILQVVPLGQHWPTVDPFLFCVHHDDAYPNGNERLGPDAPLTGRDIGQDFSGRDGWSMYHGDTVPGFPQHPHRGFETVTIARRGLVDHSDSLGAAARFGRGDVQWLTAGNGIVHSEMFPLLERDRPNPVELFQIWLNLPASDKRVDPYFTMLWSHEIPRVELTDQHGRRSEVAVIAGALDGRVPPAPPPDSWAARGDADVAIWHLRLAPGARWELPPARHPEAVRTLYFFSGSSLTVATQELRGARGVLLDSRRPVTLTAGDDGAEALMLQGRPIGEPVARYGPFVMNTEDEIHEAFADYRRTRFGGWPWPVDDPTHGRDTGRFARHPDGRVVTV